MTARPAAIGIERLSIFLEGADYESGQEEIAYPGAQNDPTGTGNFRA
jgi:hypothetical protein